MKSFHSLVLCVFLPFHTLSPASASPTILTAPTSTPSDPSSYTSASVFQSSILNSTNTYRAQHNASALTWNATLAAYASTYANTCNWAHSLGPYGENLAAAYPSAGAVVASWGDERASFDFARPRFAARTGHFSQLVWKATAGVGCGRCACAGRNGVDGWFVVCEYWPAGNVVGRFEENVQGRVGRGFGDGFIGRSEGWGVGARAWWTVGFWAVGAALVM